MRRIPFDGERRLHSAMTRGAGDERSAYRKAAPFGTYALRRSRSSADAVRMRLSTECRVAATIVCEQIGARDRSCAVARGRRHHAASGAAFEIAVNRSSVAAAAPESSGGSGAADASRQVRYCARDEQRRAGIEQHDVARRACGAIQHVAGNARILRGIGAAQRLRRRFRQADVSRMDIERVDCPVSILRHLRVPGRRDLVEPVSAVHDPRPRGSEHAERARDELGELRARHADQLPLGAGGIRQRSQEG